MGRFTSNVAYRLQNVAELSHMLRKNEKCGINRKMWRIYYNMWHICYNIWQIYRKMLQFGLNVACQLQTVVDLRPIEADLPLNVANSPHMLHSNREIRLIYLKCGIIIIKCGIPTIQCGRFTTKSSRHHQIWQPYLKMWQIYLICDVTITKNGRFTSNDAY